MFKTEIELFLNSDIVADFISVATEKTLEEYRALSDFERFALVLSCSDAIRGSGISKRFFELVVKLSGQSLSLNQAKSREVQIRLWRSIHGCCSSEKSEACDAPISCVDYCRSDDSDSCFDIVGYLSSNFHFLPNSVYEFIESPDILSIESFFMRSKDFTFSRPDEYHVSQIYQKLCSGEKCKKDELGVLALHVICTLGKRGKRTLKIFVDDDVNDAFLICELFKKRSSDVKIIICFDLFSDAPIGQIFTMMLENGKKISSEIIVPEDVDSKVIEAQISRILDVIPASKVKFV